MKTFVPELSILPEVQRQLWEELSPTVPLGFTLYGGTAVALWLGHRDSVDFDFFSDRQLDKAAIRSAIAAVANGTEYGTQTDNTLRLETPGGVKLSFFGGLNMGRVGEPQLTADGVLSVASLEDLMATKLVVLVKRGEMKDYHDLAAMLAAGTSLGHGLAAGRAMYGPNFRIDVALRALGSHADGEIGTLPKPMLKALTLASQSQPKLPEVEVVRSLSHPQAPQLAEELRSAKKTPRADGGGSAL